ncbi:Calcium-binding protein KRP1 [Camellia lanceoleosa]|uniref:Calcium-binding protein KRP1 n=1 Tax=Camellia lanceoleosa TaxID=1840588 RepID=A0ACC0HZM8_9ERIC|nr:Calcium-binding protein KRP1 [Camellia lanceoleosa]
MASSDSEKEAAAAAAAVAEEEEEEDEDKEAGDWEEAKRIIDGDGDALTAKITQDKEIALHVAVATGNKDEDYWRYIPLLKAALRGDWDSAKKFFDQDESALTANINIAEETALHVAIRSGRSIEFVEKLVDLMPPEALALRTFSNMTALHLAALYGNTKAAVILVEKHPTSLYIRYNKDQIPLHYAANNGHKDTFLYLLSVAKEDDPVSKPFPYPSGAKLLYQPQNSLKINAALLGLQKLRDDDLREMLREDDFDSDGALNQMQFCILMFRLSPELMEQSLFLFEETL